MIGSILSIADVTRPSRQIFSMAYCKNDDQHHHSDYHYGGYSYG